MKILVVSSDRTSDDHFPINLGDALLTDALATALRDRGHSPIVADFGATRSGGGEPRRTLSGLRGLASGVREADAVVVGGGTLLQDNGSRSGFGGLPRLCATVVGIARATGTPVAFYAVGCDPVTRFGPTALLRFAVHKVPVWVRDADSVKRVEGHLRGSAHLGADASLLLHRVDSGNVDSATSGPLVLALNRAHVAALTASSVIELRRRYGSVVFLNMSQGRPESRDSVALSPDVLAELDLVTSALTWREAADVIAGASAVVASRMHALYAAMLAARPMVAVSDLPKVVTFANEFGIARVASVTELAGVQPEVADPDAHSQASLRAVTSLDDMLATLVLR